jgi:hypothetical protein
MSNAGFRNNSSHSCPKKILKLMIEKNPPSGQIILDSSLQG